MRVRLAVEAAIDANLTVFVQLQDVRLWGEETHPLFDYRADNLDLHQGYIRYQGERLDWLTATIGRMEATFGGERLVGPVGWTQQGQSFDGVRADAAKGWGTVSAVAYRIGEETAASVAVDRELYGTYATLPDVQWPATSRAGWKAPSRPGLAGRQTSPRTCSVRAWGRCSWTAEQA
jgi:hypothetical protein